MNAYIATELQNFSKKARGYNMLFNYRLMNLCIKAEPAALMPVTVNYYGREYNLEEVAEIRRPDEYHLEIRAHEQENLKDITAGIFEVHPEFILDLKTEKDPNDNDVQYAFYSMPDVNKDRYDLLNNLTKVFYNECAANIDAAYAKQQAQLAEALLNAPIAEADEIKGTAKSIYDGAKEETQKMRDAKLQEIEGAYQKYLQDGGSNNNQSQSGSKESPEEDNDVPEGPLDFDVTKGMKFE